MFELLRKLFGGGTSKKSAPAKKDLIGSITHYYGKVNAAVIKVKNGPLSMGDTIRIYGKHADFEQQVTSMQIDHRAVEKAANGAEIGLEVKKKVHVGDEVYRVVKS